MSAKDVNNNNTNPQPWNEPQAPPRTRSTPPGEQRNSQPFIPQKSTGAPPGRTFAKAAQPKSPTPSGQPQQQPQPHMPQQQRPYAPQQQQQQQQQQAGRYDPTTPPFQMPQQYYPPPYGAAYSYQPNPAMLAGRRGPPMGMPGMPPSGPGQYIAQFQIPQGGGRVPPRGGPPASGGVPPTTAVPVKRSLALKIIDPKTGKPLEFVPKPKGASATSSPAAGPQVAPATKSDTPTVSTAVAETTSKALPIQSPSGRVVTPPAKVEPKAEVKVDAKVEPPKETKVTPAPAPKHTQYAKATTPVLPGEKPQIPATARPSAQKYVPPKRAAVVPPSEVLKEDPSDKEATQKEIEREENEQREKEEKRKAEAAAAAAAIKAKREAELQKDPMTRAKSAPTAGETTRGDVTPQDEDPRDGPRPDVDDEEEEDEEVDNEPEEDEEEEEEEDDGEDMGKMKFEDLGKILYSINELLDINLKARKFCKRKPEGWPHQLADIQLGYEPGERGRGGWDRGRGGGGGRYDDRRSNSRGDMRNSGGFQTVQRNDRRSNNNRGGGRDNNRGYRGGRDGGRDGRRDNRGGGRDGGRQSAPMPGVEATPLERSQNAFRPGLPADEKTQVMKKVNGILNKLTLDKFDTLKSQLVALIEEKITEATMLSEVVAVLFEKALSEAFFAEMYAQLCASLSRELNDFDEIIEDPGDPTKKQVFSTNFKRILLTKCQAEFEAGVKETDVSGLEKPEAERKMLDQKKRMLGNIRFVGELYKRKMISETIMHNCIQHLLAEMENPQEEDLEALCKLMTTIGKQIDHVKAKKYMKAYFDRLKALSEHKKLSSRVRFMIQDLIDLRKRKWVARNKKSGPKTIAEVRKENEKEQIQKGQNRPAGRGAPPGGGRMAQGRGDVRTLQRGGSSAADTKRPRDRYAMYSSPAQPPVRSASNGNPVVRSIQKPPAAPAAAKPAEPVEKISREEAEKKYKAAILEFTSAQDLKEIALCLDEVKDTTHRHLFVTESLNLALDKGDNERALVEKMLLYLFKEQRLTHDDFRKGFMEVLEFLPDMVIDLPKMPQHIAHLAAALLNDAAMSLDFLGKGGLQSIPDSDAALREKTLALVFQEVKECKNQTRIVSVFHNTAVDMQALLADKTSKGVADFVEKHKLEWFFPVAKVEHRVQDMIHQKSTVPEIQAFLDKEVPAETRKEIQWHLLERMALRAVITNACGKSTCAPGANPAAPQKGALDQERDLFECYVPLILSFNLDTTAQPYMIQEAYKYAALHDFPEGLFARLLQLLLTHKVVSDPQTIFDWQGRKPVFAEEQRRKMAAMRTDAYIKLTRPWKKNE